jgi:hypothetical protein
VASGGSAYDLAHKAGFDQLVRHRITVGCRVYDERQLFWTAIAKGTDQDVGKSGTAKARYENGRSIHNVGESLCCGASSFVDRHRW